MTLEQAAGDDEYKAKSEDAFDGRQSAGGAMGGRGGDDAAGDEEAELEDEFVAERSVGGGESIEVENNAFCSMTRQSRSASTR